MTRWTREYWQTKRKKASHCSQAEEVADGADVGLDALRDGGVETVVAAAAADDDVVHGQVNWNDGY